MIQFETELQLIVDRVKNVVLYGQISFISKGF